MGDMPNEIYCGNDGWFSFKDVGAETKYIRADIHEAELTKLRNALDVAENVANNMRNIINCRHKTGYCQVRDSGSENNLWHIEITDDQYKIRTALLDKFDNALTTIKQARGEG